MSAALLATPGFAAAATVEVNGLFQSSRAMRSPDGGRVVQVNAAAASALLAAQENVLIRDFPLEDGGSVSFAVRRFEVFAPGARIIESNGSTQRALAVPPLAFFQGAALDDPKKHLVLSIGEDANVWALVRSNSAVDMVLSPAGGAARDIHTIHRVQSSEKQFCNGAVAPFEGSAPPRSPRSGAGGSMLEVDILIDVGHGLLTSAFGGNGDTATQYVARLFAGVSGIYQRDLRIVPRIVFLQLWPSPEPFAGANTEAQLNNYRTFNTTDPARISVPRDLAHYLSNGSGGLAFIQAACSANLQYAVSNMHGTETLPTIGYSRDIDLVAHEMGHNLGSRHTHCYSPPLDHCYNQTPRPLEGEEDCYMGPLEDREVGETMSYCRVHQMGFTAPVVNVIRAFAESADCLAIKAPICGDGVRDDGEACDDGNTSDGDCCSATCASALPCGPSAIGTSRIDVYRKSPSGRRVAHAARVKFAPTTSAPTMDWLKHKTKARVYYRTGKYACVEGIAAQGRIVRGWVRKSQIKNKKLVKKLPAPPAEIARRICEFGKTEDRSRCALGCDPDRPDARPGTYACGPDEPADNPCYTTTLCTVRQAADLLFDPNQPGDIVHAFKRKRYCTGPIGNTCIDDADCSGHKCRTVGKSFWGRTRLGVGRRVGLGTAYKGGPRSATLTAGGPFVWVAAFPPRSPYREVPSGWVPRKSLCCTGTAAADNDPACGMMAGRGSEVPEGAVRGSRAAACTVDCCDGTGSTLAAEDPVDCIDRAADADVCDRGACDVARLQFDGTDLITQVCQECCALCTKRRAYHLVLGGCDDCAASAADYCAVGDRGKLDDARQFPLGTCIEDPTRECRIECCNGTTVGFQSGSRNECLVEAMESDACESNNCTDIQRVIFNGQPIFDDGCYACLTDLGTFGGSGSGASAINNAGQVVGGSSFLANDWYAHAFLYHDGVMRDLGTLGGSSSGAWAINDAGQVVGRSDTANGSHAFLYSGGVMMDLGTLGGIESEAVAINAAGQVIGNSLTANGERHAFLYSGGVMTDLGTLGGNASEAVAINASGQVIGNSLLANGERHAFLYNGGVLTDLGTLGGRESEAAAINAHGQVVGTSHTVNAGPFSNRHAFLYSAGVMMDLGTLGAQNFYSAAYDINDAGQVVGSSNNPADVNFHHAFLYSGGVMTDLGTLGGKDSIALFINEGGQVVGHSSTTNREYNAFLYDSGVMMDLGTLGGRSSTARAINDVGQVVGSSVVTHRPFRFHAFLYGEGD